MARDITKEFDASDCSFGHITLIPYCCYTLLS